MPKSPRRKTKNVIPMPSSEASRPVLDSPAVTDSDIARRAFELYCARGQQDGHDVDDWLRAERELREGASSTAA